MKKKKLHKIKYCPFLIRLSSTSLDIGIMGVILAVTKTFESLIICLIVFIAYYIIMERWKGRTFGKIAMGLEMMNVDGKTKPTKHRLILRTVLRLFWPIMLFTWNRVSLLDLFTGCRVYKHGAVVRPLEVYKGWR